MFQVIVQADSLHRRQAPGSTADSIGFFAKATVLQVLGIDSSGTWLQVQEVGKPVNTGWCSARYLVPHVAGVKAPWLEIAVKEIGVKEFPGADNNHPRILQYLATVNDLSAIDKLRDETAWCSCFMNWCIEQTGLFGTGSAWAKSWGNWRSQVALAGAQIGDIAVFDRSSAAGAGGHVAMFIAMDSGKQNMLVVGGNQTDSVRYAWYPLDGMLAGTTYRLLSVRRP